MDSPLTCFRRLVAVAVALLASAAFTSASAQVVMETINRNGDAGGNSHSHGMSYSKDMKYVVFSSMASDLVFGDTNNTTDIFIRDRHLRVTRRVSVRVDGRQVGGSSHYPSLSAENRYVAFFSDSEALVPDDTNHQMDVFVKDLATEAVTRVSVSSSGVEGDGFSYSMFDSISGDGRYILFNSEATNLVSGDTNGHSDAFLRDRDPDADGIFDQGNGTTRRLIDAASSRAIGMSDDGRMILLALPDDVDGMGELFVLDRDPDGNGVFEDNEVLRRITFGSSGEEPDGTHGYAAIAANGGFVCFQSFATNLVPGDTNGQPDIFLHDLGAQTTTRVSLAWDGSEPDFQSTEPSISDDGRFVAFLSDATNLVPDDLNGFQRDVFVRDRVTGSIELVSRGVLGDQGPRGAYGNMISPDGRYVGFFTNNHYIPELPPNGIADDVYTRDRISLDTEGAPSPMSLFRFRMRSAFGEIGNTMLALLSASGTSGIPLPGGKKVYLTLDGGTQIGLVLASHLSATIDLNGEAHTPWTPFPSVQPGISFFAAAVTMEPATSRFVSTTSPIKIVTQ